MSIPVKKSVIVALLIVGCCSITFLTINKVMAQGSEIHIKNNDDEKNKLEVITNINLQNISKVGLLKVVGVINGEDFVKNIPLDKLKDSTKKLKVTFSMNKDNDINIAYKPDKFFVCAYHVENPNNIKSVSFDKQNNDAIVDKFDCNEGDLLDVGTQVYAKSHAVYLASPNQSINSNSANDKVKIKIYAPLADKKNTEKLKLVVALNGQIQSQIIEDVQAELDKSKNSIITRIFTFDTKTDIGPIQIGDRYHACAVSEDLRPPEGSECEKRVIKSFDKINGLYVR